MSLLESVNEKPALKAPLFARRILPLVAVSGVVFVTHLNAYFQPSHAFSTKRVKKIPLENIAKLFRRRFELRYIGLEMIIQQPLGQGQGQTQSGFSSNSSSSSSSSKKQRQDQQQQKCYYFAFENEEMRDEVYVALARRVRQDCIFDTTLDKVTFMWQNR